MTPEKIISVVEMYEDYLRKQGVLKIQMDPKRYFGKLSFNEILAHAHYLCDGAKEYAQDLKRQDKANRHLAAIQMCLGFACFYTLEELMEHNKS